jgi:hypothetical protein
MTAPSSLVQLVREIQDDVAATDGQYAALYRERPTHPIPFFGPLPDARVVTIGRNPSAGEFDHNEWPILLSAAALTERLLGYFEAPHPWFLPWDRALAALGCTYRTDAAHLDLSPRAIRSTVPKHLATDFHAMMLQDLRWLPALLDAAPQLQLVLMAGSVTGNSYISEFVGRYGARVGLQLEGAPRRGAGRGWVQDHVLVCGLRRLPVYFCSSGPSARMTSAYLVAERVEHDAARLRKHLVER